MQKHRYVHLSDIHFGQETYGDKPIHEDVRRVLLNDCEYLRQSIGPAQGIIVTGDIAFSGKPEQYARAGEWLDQLTEKVGCANIAVALVPGNHDVDISKIGGVCEQLHKDLRRVPLDELDHLLGSIGHDALGNPLLEKLNNYRVFAERYGCDFKPSNNQPDWIQPYWSKALLLEDQNKISFVGLTSVLVSDLSDSIGKLALGNQQYIISRENCSELVVMMHHPICWFRDHENVDNYLKRARVVLVGHEHNLKVRHIGHEDGETLWIHAGSTNSIEGREPYQYRYNWLEFSFCVRDKSAYLEVIIYPRVWDPSRTRFVPDQNLLHGRDSMTYYLPCPEFQVRHHEQVRHADLFSERVIIQPTGFEIEESMNDNDWPFKRLRYLFWKYLDWNERLRVLKELGIISPSQSQPIPLVMERLALESAMKDGKLPALWDAIIAYIPENQREPNPF